MKGWKDERMERWKDGRMEGWRDEKMEGWKDGKMEGWRKKLTKLEGHPVLMKSSASLTLPMEHWEEFPPFFPFSFFLSLRLIFSLPSSLFSSYRSSTSL